MRFRTDEGCMTINKRICNEYKYQHGLSSDKITIRVIPPVTTGYLHPLDIRFNRRVEEDGDTLAICRTDQSQSSKTSYYKTSVFDI